MKKIISIDTNMSYRKLSYYLPTKYRNDTLFKNGLQEYSKHYINDISVLSPYYVLPEGNMYNFEFIKNNCVGVLYENYLENNKKIEILKEMGNVEADSIAKLYLMVKAKYCQDDESLEELKEVKSDDFQKMHEINSQMKYGKKGHSFRAGYDDIWEYRRWEIFYNMLVQITDQSEIFRNSLLNTDNDFLIYTDRFKDFSKFYPKDDYEMSDFGCGYSIEEENKDNPSQWRSPNIYGYILNRLRKRYQLYYGKTLEEVLHQSMKTIYDMNKFSTTTMKSKIFVGGSFAVKEVEKYIDMVFDSLGIPFTTRPWVPNDIDIFITDFSKTSLLGLLHSVFIHCEFIGGNNRQITIKVPYQDIKFQIVRLKQQITFSNEYKCSQICEFMENAIDISTTCCYLIYEPNEDNVDEEYLISKYSHDKTFQNWNLYSKKDVVDDVEIGRVRFHRKPEDPLYEYGLKRVEKYKERGYTLVEHIPKELTDAVDGYWKYVLGPVQLKEEYPYEN